MHPDDCYYFLLFLPFGTAALGKPAVNAIALSLARKRRFYASTPKARFAIPIVTPIGHKISCLLAVFNAPFYAKAKRIQANLASFPS